jgi:hypothetical protein
VLGTYIFSGNIEQHRSETQCNTGTEMRSEAISHTLVRFSSKKDIIDPKSEIHQAIANEVHFEIITTKIY